MYYTGIDLHKKTSYITTVDEKGRIVARGNFGNIETVILEHFMSLGTQGQIVIESMSSWYWLYDLLTGSGFKVVVSNPVKTKAIASAKIKSDKLDSHMLAQLLRAGLICTIHVSSLETPRLKELLRHRNRLVQDATRMKNRIHNLLMKNNCQIPISDLFGLEGLGYLKEIDLPCYHRESLETYLHLHEGLKEQIEPLTMAVHGLAKENAMAKLLMTIPGIGPIVAMYMVAEIEDVRRFPSYRHLCSYAGLVPSLDFSGGKERTGRITKQGSPHLRTALIEAAHAIARMKMCRLKIFFRRCIVKSGCGDCFLCSRQELFPWAGDSHRMIGRRS